MKLYENGVYLVNGTELVEEGADALTAVKSKTGLAVTKEEAAQNTIAYGILKDHNVSGSMDRLQIKFDKLTSHDITFVGIIQTARASGLEKFPVPYVLTNCHNSLCAVGGTINEDDHMFGLTCARKYGGVYVPPHQAVIHQFAREMLACAGAMILGSDSHTRYGALGTMAIGEGGPELVKQLLNKTYDIDMPGVVGVYLKGTPVKGVGPQDVALAIIGAVFDRGYVKNKVMEFVGPGVSNLSADFRIGVDVMTTETTCLSSIWQTDEKIKEFYEIHGRSGDYKELHPGKAAYYDGMIEIDLGEIRPMIAMPFHPSNTYTIEELNANLPDILDDCEKRARVSFDGAVELDLKSKVRDGRLYLRVVDYKSGRKAFDLSAVRMGLDIQMLLYLFTLQKEGSGHFGREIEPAGVLYLPARDEILSMERNVAPEKLKSEREKQLRRSGLLLAEPAVLQAMEHDALREPRYLPLRVNRSGELSGSIASAAQLGRLGQYVERQLRQIARELRQGNIDADPWCRGEDDSCCKYCQWASAYHFQDGRDGDHLRYILPVKAEDFWQEIGEEEE